MSTWGLHLILHCMLSFCHMSGATCLVPHAGAHCSHSTNGSGVACITPTNGANIFSLKSCCPLLLDSILSLKSSTDLLGYDPTQLFADYDCRGHKHTSASPYADFVAYLLVGRFWAISYWDASLWLVSLLEVCCSPLQLLPDYKRLFWFSSFGCALT